MCCLNERRTRGKCCAISRQTDNPADVARIVRCAVAIHFDVLEFGIGKRIGKRNDHNLFISPVVRILRRPIGIGDRRPIFTICGKRKFKFTHTGRPITRSDNDAIYGDGFVEFADCRNLSGIFTGKTYIGLEAGKREIGKTICGSVVCP